MSSNQHAHVPVSSLTTPNPEDGIIEAIDAKATLEKSLTPKETLGVLVAVGILPSTDDMTLQDARRIYMETHRTLAGMNFMRQIYEESLQKRPINMVAGAYPYVLRKEAEDLNVNVDVTNPLEGWSVEEREEIRRFTAVTLKRRLGMERD